MPSFELCRDGRLALGDLRERASPPEPFAVGAPFWTDPYISERLLESHLDPNEEGASRPHDRVDAEVE